MKGSFDTNDKINGFITPLKSLGDIMGDVGVVFNINSKEKTINIYALNGSLGTLVYLKYVGDLLDTFTFAPEDEKIGVLKVADFVRYFSVLDDAGVSLEFENTSFSIQHDGGKLSFKTADPDMIEQAPKNFKGATWFSTIAIDSKFAKLHKAMNVLANEDCLFVNGSNKEGKLSFNVRSSSVDINSFKVQLDTPVAQDFDSAYRKDVVQMILRTPSDSINMSFADRLAKFECKSKYYEMTYYVAKKTTSKP